MDSGAHVCAVGTLTTELSLQPPYAGLFFFFFLEQLQAAADPNVLLIPGLDLFSLNSDLRFLRPHKGGHDEKCPLNPRLPTLEAPGLGGGVGSR